MIWTACVQDSVRSIIVARGIFLGEEESNVGKTWWLMLWIPSWGREQTLSASELSTGDGCVSEDWQETGKLVCVFFSCSVRSLLAVRLCLKFSYRKRYPTFSREYISSTCHHVHSSYFTKDPCCWMRDTTVETRHDFWSLVEAFS